MTWNDKRYHSLDFALREQFGEKIYKVSLDGGMTCPNRDGTLGNRGCIFCSEQGSGDFAAPVCESVTTQIDRAIEGVSKKVSVNHYIAYFQSFTNTYAPVEYLRKIFTEAVMHPKVAVLSVATRPDCLPDEVVFLLKELNRIKPVWVELGLQSMHERTAFWMRRGYQLSCFDEAVVHLKENGLTVIVHAILGLAGESEDDVLLTMNYLNKCRVDGVKLQLLHVLKGTDLEREYREGKLHILTFDEYIDLVISCLEYLSPDIVIHRVTGDGPGKLMVAPMWSTKKRVVLNTLHNELKKRDTWQGRLYQS